MFDPSQTGDSQPLHVPAVHKQYYGIFGNLPDIDTTNLATSIWRLADLYGPIYSLELGGKTTIVISSYELMQDASNDERFRKTVSGALVLVRDSVGDGLFTAYWNEPNWGKAHRILMPVFGPIAVRKMFDEQLNIASQMILKWDRLGPENRILAADDFTRLAFDTIGLCAFSYRFNEFYSDNVHPFASQMSSTLIEAGKRFARPAIVDRLHYFENQKYWQDINAMHALCQGVIDDRIKNPQPDNHDLLNVMLNTEDPETGEKLSPENVKYQMATFLVAGHETTSGTLSFLFLNMLQNPETYHRAQKEVDEVLGNDALEAKHLPKLVYVDACIKETLRYMGPITMVRREPIREGLKLGDKYVVPKGATITCNLKGVHHDHAAWGEDVDKFSPDRFIPLSKVKTGAYCPFGVGVRSCIGRAFAEQEMLINVALILQRFQVELADPSYQLSLKATLTIKPDNLYLKVRRRPGKSDMVGLQSQGVTKENKHGHNQAREGHEKKDGEGKKSPVTILYGSNAGTCKAYAEELVASASSFDIKVQSMDVGTENLPTDQPVVIITPSYEGKPTDNAKKFVSWLESTAEKESSDTLKGVRYTVFGVGNSEWAATFHKIPKLVDASMAKLGAERIMDCGFVDVKTDPAGPWEDFLDNLLSTLGQEGGSSNLGSQQEVKAAIVPAESTEVLMGTKSLDAVVVDNIEIADDSVGPPKKHIEIELPDDVTYKSGDYLAVLPFNHADIILRVLKRFKLRTDSQLMIEGTNKKYLKTTSPTSVYDFLASRVELNTPITRKQLSRLAAITKDSKEKSAVERLANDDGIYQKEVLAKRMSVLDVLEDNPSCELPFGSYLDMLQGLALRQYSISSSPLSPKNFGSDRKHVSLTYDVHVGSEIANEHRQFHGVASYYLARLNPGSRINCAVKSTNTGFRLPKDDTVPIIMIAAGTGLAPMRGFIQERASIARAQDKSLGPALFYFGCRDYEKDFIYKDELNHWEEIGVVQMRPAFSKRAPPDAEKSWKYAHERMWDEREEVANLFKQGAKIFVCGSASKLAKSVSETCKKIYGEKVKCSDEEADAWLDKVKEDRYVTDVFG